MNPATIQTAPQKQKPRSAKQAQLKGQQLVQVILPIQCSHVHGKVTRPIRTEKWKGMSAVNNNRERSAQNFAIAVLPTSPSRICNNTTEQS